MKHCLTRSHAVMWCNVVRRLRGVCFQGEDQSKVTHELDSMNEEKHALASYHCLAYRFKSPPSPYSTLVLTLPHFGRSTWTGWSKTRDSARVDRR